jgi:hypothetical protein
MVVSSEPPANAEIGLFGREAEMRLNMATCLSLIAESVRCSNQEL